MLLTLDYRDARPIYTQICDNIRQQILTGILCTGDRLPSVRELATQLTINPNTIQRAYTQLEMEGWITSVPGKGSFVSGIPVASEADRKAAWEELERLHRHMKQMGINTREITDYLNQGGKQDA